MVEEFVGEYNGCNIDGLKEVKIDSQVSETGE